MNHNRYVYWTYHSEYKGSKDFIDPRVPLAKHTGWKKVHGEYTDYPTPEPDNYNRAIVTNEPVECLLIKDQIIYFDLHRRHWITLMYVPDDKLNDVDIWIKCCNKQAVWCHLKPPQINKKRTLLWTRDNISDTNMTDNERLYTLGYYEKLKVKYFNDDTAYVDSLLGNARAILSNPIPLELDDADNCDN